MLLPKSAKRNETKEYEEVIIPKNEPAPLLVGNTRVQVSDLDAVSFRVFITIPFENETYKLL